MNPLQKIEAPVTNKGLDNKKEEPSRAIKRQVLIAVREYFSGPLPHPNILAKYEQIQKGAADRIIRMAEKQSAHRQEIEKKVIESNIWNERIGMILSFIIIIALIGGAIYLIRFDKNIEGLVPLVAALGITAYNVYSQQKRESQVPQKKYNEKKES